MSRLLIKVAENGDLQGHFYNPDGPGYFGMGIEFDGRTYIVNLSGDFAAYEFVKRDFRGNVSAVRQISDKSLLEKLFDEMNRVIEEIEKQNEENGLGFQMK